MRSLPSSPSTLQALGQEYIHANTPITTGLLQKKASAKKKALQSSKNVGTRPCGRGRLAVLAALERHSQARVAHTRMQMTVYYVNFFPII